MWSEPILHVDMDSFFVEVERLADPALMSQPVAVGGTGKRGVIASASYEARAFGVRSAQPTGVARSLCPELVVVSPRHGKYGDYSEKVFSIFRSFTPKVEGLSLDEAFLDVSGLRHHYETSPEVGEAVRFEIKQELGLPASVGVASNKFLAKLASEEAKPDGLRHIPVDNQLEFLHGLPVEVLWGVGPATLAGLQRLGIERVGDLTEIPERTLAATLGPTQGAHLRLLAQGVDNRPVEAQTGAKSLSVEETFAEDLAGRDMVQSALMAHAQRLSVRLRRAGLLPHTISLKIRYSDFTTLTRSRTFQHTLSQPRELYRAAIALLEDVPDDQPVRLLGLGGSQFDRSDTPQQESLDSDDAWRKLGDAVGDVQDRFGTRSVGPARLIDWRETDRSPDT